MPEPLGETTVTRSWGWGIAVFGDPTAPLPERPDGVVTVAGGAVVVRLRRDDATAHLRVVPGLVGTGRTVLCDAVLDTPSGKLTFGDGDGVVTVEAGGAARHRVVVSAVEVPEGGLEELWIDAVPEN